MTETGQPTTLKDLLEKHPEYADLPIVLYRNDGSYEWMGGSMACYKSFAPTKEQEKAVNEVYNKGGNDTEAEACMTEVLVMSGN